MGKFTIKTGNDGQFYFNLKADNGQVILTSEGYKARAGCDNGIESVRKNAPDSTNYEKLTAANGKFYFNLKAANGQVIGKSQMYEGQDGCDNGIQSVMKNAPDATVEEE
ncbi:MAG: YegP family protein [Dinghuibacter sp.]|nr:YegP family protein [Dinghuibacter sp.]